MDSWKDLGAKIFAKDSNIPQKAGWGGDDRLNRQNGGWPGSNIPFPFPEGGVGNSLSKLSNEEKYATNKLMYFKLISARG